ncbi:MAG: IclR family transcriptional regulator, partial [Pseudomonadales bacterium]|nr:IclR family transcriptional regulator [Pseudomonadales bacterium]
ECGMQESTVHRILGKLSTLGYVEQVEETGCYRARLRMWELGTAIINEHPVRRVATPFVHQLHDATGETVSLTILDGDDVLYLDKVISPRAVRFTTRVGSRVPAPLTAGGKAILAQLDDARGVVRRTIRRIKTSRQVTVETLMQEIDDARRHGYAVSRFSPGVVSFAAAIVARDGHPAAALSVSAPEERLDDEKRANIIEKVRVTCAEIAERVGPL